MKDATATTATGVRSGERRSARLCIEDDYCREGRGCDRQRLARNEAIPERERSGGQGAQPLPSCEFSERAVGAVQACRPSGNGYAPVRCR